MDPARPFALVTGGNAGIGFETVVGLVDAGWHVVFTSRDPLRGARACDEIRERAAAASGAVEMMTLDLASFRSIRAFAAEFLARGDRLSLLVNNAGLAPAGIRRETEDGFEAAFGVNHLGHFLLTTLLEDRLRQSAPARIVVVSSGAYRAAKRGLCWDDLQHERDFHSFQVYGESKLANIYFTRSMAERMRGSGVTINATNPGYVESGLGRLRPEDEQQVDPATLAAVYATRQPMPSDPKPTAYGAASTLRLALDPTLDGVTGQYFDEGELVELRGVAADRDEAQRLWEISERLVARP